ncbi:TetR family transcriptional regulator [Mycetocola tolaasinivorans]|uniref:TetR family transcriptional regulator n=1 Tax=Mycetocola tolaasinivorans TaxID=76635 RepID=A0A3L7ABQ2_9MICO|nr:TetR/AcrR family transcriptional regulator [Mycetocola tolaasinivorans]RLP77916.1 TetR family transcriptional regulator [Mycetocola tolaasinivorans]
MTIDRRADIVSAARAQLVEQDPHGISVRAVAARAGVGASTLRHYFPSQKDLHHAVLATFFDETVADLRIADPLIPAAERLRECLEQFVPPEITSDSLRLAVSTFLGPAAVPGADEIWGFYADHARGRIRAWLTLLATEGALNEADVERHARLLMAIADGLAIGRMAGAERPTLEQEYLVIADAVAAVLG